MSRTPLVRHWMMLQLVAFCLSLVAMSGMRWLFYLVNDETLGGAQAALLRTAFLHGVRFDAAVLGLLIAVAFLASLPFSFWRPRIAKAVWVTLFGIGLTAILAVSFGDIFYSQYAGKRLSFEISVFFTSQAFPLIATAASDFPVLFPLASIVIGGVIYSGWRLYGSVPTEAFAHQAGLKGIASICLFVVLVTFVSRGGVQGRPLRVGDGFVTGDPAVNQLVFNAPFLTLGSLQFSSDRMPKLMASGAAYQFCREGLESGSRFVSDEYPFLRVSAQRRPPVARPNVYVILLESGSKKYIYDARYAYLTPNIQRLRAGGLSFENAYATGTRSPNGVYSVVTGFPDFIHDTVMRRPQLATDFVSMADVFRSRGYDTYFLHGGNLDFDNLEGFLRHQGFQHMYGKRDFPDVPSKVWWGVPDGVMYDLGLKVLGEARQPYFSLVFTTSTHGPYSLPDEFRPTVAVPQSHPEADYLRALHYADQELGRFLAELERKGHLKDSVIVLTGDHSHHTGLNLMEDKEVPLIFYGPGYVKAGESPRLASQIDVLPTLSAILGFDEVESSLGRDLRRNPLPDHNYAYWVSGGTINLRWNDLIATQSEGDSGSLRFYSVPRGFGEQAELPDGEKERLKKALYAMYECSTRPVLEDRVFSPNVRE